MSTNCRRYTIRKSPGGVSSSGGSDRSCALVCIVSSHAGNIKGALTLSLKTRLVGTLSETLPLIILSGAGLPIYEGIRASSETLPSGLGRKKHCEAESHRGFERGQSAQPHDLGRDGH